MRPLPLLRTRFVVALAVCTVGFVVSTANMLGAELASAASRTHSRSVSLSDARFAPSVLVYVRAGETYTLRHARPCKGKRGRSYFTDVSAYTWQGGALGAQTWDAGDEVYAWRAPSGRVAFDGRTFHNETSAPVLVAGWCE